MRWWCVVLGCGGGQKQFPEETTMTPPEECWARNGSQKKLPGLFQKIGLGPQWPPEEVTVEISLPEDRFGPKAVPRRNYRDSPGRSGLAPGDHQKKLLWRYLFQRIALGPKQFPEEATMTLPEDRVGFGAVSRKSYRGDAARCNRMTTLNRIIHRAIGHPFPVSRMRRMWPPWLHLVHTFYKAKHRGNTAPSPLWRVCTHCCTNCYKLLHKPHTPLLRFVQTVVQTATNCCTNCTPLCYGLLHAVNGIFKIK